jgi:hypothetical protein
MPLEFSSLFTSAMKFRSPIVLPERFTSSVSSRPCLVAEAISRIACWVTQRSTPPISPKRSAVARKAAGSTISPCSPRIRSSSSCCVVFACFRSKIGVLALVGLREERGERPPLELGDRVTEELARGGVGVVDRAPGVDQDDGLGKALHVRLRRRLVDSIGSGGCRGIHWVVPDRNAG